MFRAGAGTEAARDCAQILPFLPERARARTRVEMIVCIALTARDITVPGAKSIWRTASRSSCAGEGKVIPFLHKPVPRNVTTSHDERRRLLGSPV
ncbi:MAG: hypothetical protein B7Z66_07315 [Chromatiales bacterium 21-64-14]|nr:MAG: hypothetical protein B7Z66_07315 [Chromatiales bacterium 21-64-14]